MRCTIAAATITCAVAWPTGHFASQASSKAATHRLEELSWNRAAEVLTADAVVLVPLGAAAKEHGPHLKLSNDKLLAEHLTDRVARATPVVVAPALTYHFYPAFVEYPGSTSLSFETARELTNEVVRTLARHGPKRFYILNTGISTNRPLAASAEALSREGLLMRFTSLDTHLDAAARGIREQAAGSHADELETSMTLHLDPQSVDMSKAVKDLAPRSTPFTLTRRAGGPGMYSPTGIWGDPTLATAEKGRVLVDALVAGIVEEIAALRKASPPAPLDKERLAETSPRPPATPTAGEEAGERCSAGDERFIRSLGDAFTAHWANADAIRLAGLWAAGGDVGHPDGWVERTAQMIRINRLELFRRPEYRLSRHPLQLGVIRCLTSDVAVADGKWELRYVTDANGKVLPTAKGLCTLVVKRADGAWRIESYRYTVDPSGPPPPILLKRPGYPGRGGGPA